MRSGLPHELSSVTVDTMVVAKSLGREERASTQSSGTFLAKVGKIRSQRCGSLVVEQLQLVVGE